MCLKQSKLVQHDFKTIQTNILFYLHCPKKHHVPDNAWLLFKTAHRTDSGVGAGACAGEDFLGGATAGAGGRCFRFSTDDRPTEATAGDDGSMLGEVRCGLGGVTVGAGGRFFWFDTDDKGGGGEDGSTSGEAGDSLGGVKMGQVAAAFAVSSLDLACQPQTPETHENQS